MPLVHPPTLLRLMRKPFSIRSLLLVALLSASACVGDLFGPKSHLEGVYLLETMNGLRLPLTSDGPSTHVELHHVVLIVDRDGNFAETYFQTLTTKTDGATHETKHVYNGAIIDAGVSGICNLLNCGIRNAQVSGRELTLTGNGATTVYKRVSLPVGVTLPLWWQPAMPVYDPFLSDPGKR